MPGGPHDGRAGAAYNARFHAASHDMIELNPVRQRIADLRGRLEALRGYL